MRFIFWLIFGMCVCVFSLHAENIQLNDDNQMTGDIVNFNDIGITLRSGEIYTNIAWTKLSQETLKELSNSTNPKYKPAGKPSLKDLVEPFIETPPEQRAKKEQIHLKDESQMSRLHNPPEQSLFAALFSSSVGIVLLLLVYAANIYAGFEIAIFRDRPKGMVMGVAAVLPVLGPIIFLSMPTYVPPAPVDENIAPPEPQHFTVPRQAPVAEAQATAAQWQAASETSSQGAAQVAAEPKAPPQIFQRGQFTFNKRFIETKFSGYFGMARTGEAKNFDFFLRTGAGTFQVNRITRISVNDVHVETNQGGTVREILVPFGDIQEIQLKPR